MSSDRPCSNTSSAKKAASVLIVDDQPLIHLGLQQVLSQEFRGLVFGGAKSCHEAAVRLSTRPWDLVILSVAIPGNDGFAILQEIRRIRPAARVLMLGRHTDSRFVLRARRLGASGYLFKNAGRAELLRAVGSVLGGKDHFPPLDANDDDAEIEPRHSRLSVREYGVMLAFVNGKRPSELAADLNLSVKTISTYKRRLMYKLGVRSMSDLVHYAIDHQLS